MKRISAILILIFTIASQSEAQSEELNTGFGFGFQLSQVQRDFGLGLNLTSPYMIYDRLAVRLKGNFVWNEYINSNLESTWTAYNNLSIGLLSVAGEVGGFMRLYGEGGILMLFPSSDFSSQDTELGGYGLFGFEFFFQPNMNYYLEVGGAGTGAKADKVVGKPIYSNGLLINVGFRYVL